METTLTPEDLERIRRRRQFRNLRRGEWVFLTILFLIVVGIGINFKPVRVVGQSMEPTYHDGETVWVWRLADHYQPYQPGDVIVFRSNDGEELIKRVAFVQDVAATRRMPAALWTPDGCVPVPVLMRGYQSSEFPGYEEEIAGAAQNQPVRQTLFVLGDNTWRADDSRHFGPIAPSDVLGKVIYPMRGGGACP